MTSIDIFKGMRNFECLLQGAYEEMVEINVMLDKVQQNNEDFFLFDSQVKDPDEAFEEVNNLLLKIKNELLQKDFGCTDEEIIKYLIRRKLERI